MYKAILVKIIFCPGPSRTSRAPCRRVRLHAHLRLALEVRWKASSLLALQRGGWRLRCWPLGRVWCSSACWRTMSRAERSFGMLALVVCRRRRGRGGGGGGRRGAGYVGQCTRQHASCCTCSGRLPVIMQRQVLQSCTESFTTSVCCLSFSSSTECFFLVVNRDRYPHSCSLFSLGLGCCSTLTRSSMCGRHDCSVEACEIISLFYVFQALFAWNLDLISSSPCALRVHGGFWTIFFYFPREKWTPSSPRSSHP